MHQVKSYAKINLFLYVTERAPSGYHELLMLMSCIELHDKLTVEFDQSEITVICDHPDVPENESNLVFKAVSIFFSSLTCKTGYLNRQGIRVTIEKNIPVGAGLGGGSSNAAAVLKVMNHYYGQPFSPQELMTIAFKIGADIPFFIDARTSIVKGFGEQICPIGALSDLPESILLFYPGVAASTAEVYKNLDLGLTKQIKFNINSLLKTSGNNKMSDIDGIMHNDLEISACALYPEIGQFRKELIESVPQKIMMTGSGSTFFALFDDYIKAKHCYEALAKRWNKTGKRVFMTSFVV
ncbi:4-diphosphocytidyl-2-C-methyl-D-erythritol kinase [Desulfamplus magnetovallimortis]|uniref:4-diphosphocytidyl-2-C-methyl-D-erythritol kinase n=1 Tax=Desulfamplus magnetovallimortis TaxID=1246637 RepID=A0A1W1H9J5_9BACT|nr:4-(cytidine 5'-diphospho)-2-C-methyl-D-erythritol kinase [Desulfamplus magnetovallimortis]SLM29038.1 4-diphosphocytidyl-2-C-methyl-D-erythritol kinase [Desulfamplus magnetovallimortis]